MEYISEQSLDGPSTLPFPSVFFPSSFPFLLPFFPPFRVLWRNGVLRERCSRIPLSLFRDSPRLREFSVYALEYSMQDSGLCFRDYGNLIKLLHRIFPGV